MLPGDDALTLVGVLAAPAELREDGWLGLFGLQEQRLGPVAGVHQQDPGAGADAADPDDLAGHLDQRELLQQVPPVGLQGASVLAQHDAEQFVEGAGLHAGDWVVPELLNELAEKAVRLVACWGNNDGPVLRSRLPERADVVLDGLHFTVVHETGGPAGRESRMSRRYPDTDVLVFGHSHIPWDTTTSTGLRLLNPGSPTDRRRQPHGTIGLLTVTSGRLTQARIIPVT